jgi:hypothetical protein
VFELVAIIILESKCVLYKITLRVILRSKHAILSTSGRAPSIFENIADVFGVKCCQQLQKLNFVDGRARCRKECCSLVMCFLKPSIDGMISKAEHGTGRSQGDQQFWYVNKWMTCVAACLFDV